MFKLHLTRSNRSFRTSSFGVLPEHEDQIKPLFSSCRDFVSEDKKNIEDEVNARLAPFSCEPEALSADSQDALEDFKRYLRIMKLESMKEDSFKSILDSLGYQGDSKQVFQELLTICSAITGQRVFTLDIGVMRKLYSSLTYTACSDKIKTSTNLVGRIANIFGLHNGNDASLLTDASKISALLEFHGNEEEEKAAERELRFKFDRSNRSLSLENVAASFLQYDEEKDCKPPCTPMGLHKLEHDPAHTRGKQFVAAVERNVFEHDALQHHLLDSISKGSFGDLKTLELVCHFLTSYKLFTKHFVTYLEETTKLNMCFADILNENIEEENGNYDDDTLLELESIGLDASKLHGVTHKDLFDQCLESMKNVLPSFVPFETHQIEWIVAPLVEAFNQACIGEFSSSASSIAAMYFGSELIASTIYTKLSQYLKVSGLLNRQDLAFFLLHIDMDVDHAEHMKEIVIHNADNAKLRLEIVHVVQKILDARVAFYDRLLEAFFPPTGHGGEETGSLYNKQSTNWVRKTATCLSDFTGRPIVFDMCKPHTKGACILDIGCGEGYGSRKLVEMGASKIVGIDVSAEMIARARQNESCSQAETYLIGDATKLVDIVYRQSARLGFVPGALLEDGCFDLAVGIFLFNYTNLTQMKDICAQIFQVLKPGGRFIFSVPHPFMLNAHGDTETTDNKEKSDSTFSFSKGDGVSSQQYFSLRDRKFAGVIRRTDGQALNVKMCFKTISDYVESVKRVGFEINDLHEARVLPEHVSLNPDFFNSVKDSPLHLVFEVVKPISTNDVTKIPKKIIWSSYERKNPDLALHLQLPGEVVSELKDVVDDLVNNGLDEDNYELSDSEVLRLTETSKFAKTLRERLKVDTGAAFVSGLDLNAFGFQQGSSNAERGTKKVKLAYFILCSLVGHVDGSARGRLFDVKNYNLRVTSDNVLFSVGNNEATFHTDGASLNKSYDVASLLCLSPAADGGAFRFSNACSAFNNLRAKLPKFLMYELMRPLPRDILENGNGKGIGGSMMNLVRNNNEIMKLRVRHNSYPIFVEADGGTRLQFRYMRYWIESGFEKAQMRMSPLLRVALDLLDAELEKEQVFNNRMKPGEMVFCNNKIFAHARDSFTDHPDYPARHKVRAWIQF